MSRGYNRIATKPPKESPRGPQYAVKRDALTGAPLQSDTVKFHLASVDDPVDIKTREQRWRELMQPNEYCGR